MCFGGSSSGVQKQLAQMQLQQSQQATQDAATKASALTAGMSNINNAFGGFNDDYFNNLAKNYTDYATPQLQDQYDLSKKNITYALARGGNLNSSVAGDQQALLDKENATNLEDIAGTAQDYANTARQNVQSQKQNVVSQLDASYDPDAANTEALSSAKSLAVPVSFSPLGNMFSDIAAAAAQNKLATTVYPYGGPMGAALTPSSASSSYGVASNV